MSFPTEYGGTGTAVTPSFTSSTVPAGLTVPAADVALLIAAAPVLVLSLLGGLVGNALVCVSVYRNRGLRNANNALLVNLAAADLVVCLTVVPLTLLAVTNGLRPAGDCKPLGEALCSAHTFFHVSSSSVQLTTLVAVSLERYEAIVRPFEAKAKRRRVAVGVCLSWGLALVIAVPAAALLRRSSACLLCSCRLTERPVDYVHVVILAPLGVTCLLLVVVFYLRIFRTVRQHVKEKGKPGAVAAVARPGVGPKAARRSFLTGRLGCCGVGCCRTNTVGVADSGPPPPGLDFSPPSASRDAAAPGKSSANAGGSSVPTEVLVDNADSAATRRPDESGQTEGRRPGESPGRDGQVLAGACNSSSSGGGGAGAGSGSTSVTPDTGVGSSSALRKACSQGERTESTLGFSTGQNGQAPGGQLTPSGPVAQTEPGGDAAPRTSEAITGPTAAAITIDADRRDGGGAGSGPGAASAAAPGSGVGELQGSVCVLNPALRVRGRRNLEAKTAKRASYIIAVFGLCWLPLFVTAYLPVGLGADVLAAGVAAASAALNPVVYTVVNKAFRKEFAKMLRELADRCPALRCPRCCKRWHKS